MKKTNIISAIIAIIVVVGAIGAIAGIFGGSNSSGGGSSNSHVHDYVVEYSYPSCTEPGTKTKTCKTCDHSETFTVPAPGHTLEVTYTEVTCTEGGTHKTACTKCDYTKTEELEALGHDIIEHAEKAATCTESGHSAYVTCSRCEYTTYQGIAALGHDNVSYEAKAATCTAAGHEAYVACSRCDYTTYKAIAKVPHEYAGGSCTMCGAVGELITFTIDGVTCQAEKGMTWGEWIDSAYNPFGDFKAYRASNSEDVVMVDGYGASLPLGSVIRTAHQGGVAVRAIIDGETLVCVADEIQELSYSEKLFAAN